jgi:hypothetical protein
VLSHRVPAALFRATALRPFVLNTVYGRTHNAKKKFAMVDDPLETEMIKEVEVGLWRDNDLRTWAFTSNEFLRFDNCGVRVDLPVWHVSAKNDHFFDNHLVEQHMRVIFNGFQSGEFDMKAHAPSVLADEKEAAALIPPKLKRYLSRLK